jgi:hypothetical protein
MLLLAVLLGCRGGAPRWTEVATEERHGAASDTHDAGRREAKKWQDPQNQEMDNGGPPEELAVRKRLWERMWSGLRRCYTRAMGENGPSFAPELWLRIEVDTSGAAHAVVLTTSDRVEGFESCIVRVFEGIRFDMPGRPTTTELGLRFYEGKLLAPRP